MQAKNCTNYSYLINKGFGGLENLTLTSEVPMTGMQAPYLVYKTLELKEPINTEVTGEEAQRYT